MLYQIAGRSCIRYRLFGIAKLEDVFGYADEAWEQKP
jgi:hypothetical protein